MASAGRWGDNQLMCARFTSTVPRDELEELFGLIPFAGYVPRYNVAPSQPVPVVRSAPGGREAVALRWGLVPGWARPGSAAAAGFVNARAETLADRPAFRDAFRLRRCLVPGDGFLEWDTIAGRKQPYWFRRADGRPFAFAGLWEGPNPHLDPPAAGGLAASAGPAAGALAVGTFTILTTPANDVVHPFHDRMPAVLTPDRFAAWLDPAATESELLALLTPLPAAELTAVAVSPAVNAPRNDRPDVLRPVVASLFG